MSRKGGGGGGLGGRGAAPLPSHPRGVAGTRPTHPGPAGSSYSFRTNFNIGTFFFSPLFFFSFFFGGGWGGCFTSTETVWRIKDGGCGDRIGNESPGPPPFPAHTAFDVFSLFFFGFRVKCPASTVWRLRDFVRMLGYLGVFIIHLNLTWTTPELKATSVEQTSELRRCQCESRGHTPSTAFRHLR